MKSNSTKEIETNPEQDTPENIRRNFLKKFGKYAVSTPVVTFTLMSSFSSKAIASGGNDAGGGLGGFGGPPGPGS
ncbi:MAG: Unknown protein [uncultured Thiotrichaceae bacterium]|uniref:Uncharacterized protein n=1 Tax=uncultured Thiotrichaceae bacterium TaxID=298394 RepID=A0A6S6U393_9GAMM|nr:MAG: Unknown protein [uncultured Thiotrichaceae bacterium]